MSFTYVRMKYKIKKNVELINPEHVSYVDINQFTDGELYKLYVDTFNQGDANFYKNQSESDKRAFYERELGFPKILKQPESHAIIYNDKLIGFTYALQYGKRNVHISCMCIHPDYQNKGLGKYMLQVVEKIAKDRDMATLSLGTETSMKAYHLYESFGFKETARIEIKE